MSREHLDRLASKLEKSIKTPYLDVATVKNTVAVFEKLVNRYDTAEMFALAATMGTKDTEYIQKYMEEQGLTFPKDQDEAVDRALVEVGAQVAQIHRTLQQNFMRVVLVFIEVQAAMYEAGIYDLRNENTGRLCKAIWDSLKDREDLYLPTV